jgi:hypothetical protein
MGLLYLKLWPYFITGKFYVKPAATDACLYKVYDFQQRVNLFELGASF